MAHPTTPAWPNIPTTLCARGPAAFQHAPRPNLSFTVLGGSMAAQQVPWYCLDFLIGVHPRHSPSLQGRPRLSQAPSPSSPAQRPSSPARPPSTQAWPRGYKLAEARDDSVDGYVMASVMWFFVQIESFCFRGRLVPSEPLGGVLFEQVCHLELQQVPPRPCRPWRARASRHRPGASRPGASRPILGGDQSWSVGQHQSYYDYSNALPSSRGAGNSSVGYWQGAALAHA